MSSLSRIVKVVVAVALLAGLAGGAISYVKSRPVAVTVASPEQNVPVQVFGLGTMEARVISSLGFEVAGTLAEVTADHRDRVRRGTVLARLDAAEQRARVVRAEASVQAAEAAVARAAASFERQDAVRAQRQLTNDRQQDLLRKGVASSEKAEEAQRDLKVAEADVQLARADQQVAEASLATARADLLRETVLLEKYDLRAAFDALVVERQREPGAAVRAGDPVFTLVDPASVWVLAHVEEARAGAIAVGQPAEVRLRSLAGQVFAGKVTRIGIESDRVSEERRVWVACDTCPPDFHLGEQAEVVFTTGTLAQALLVPEVMVSGYDGHQGSIWLAENGQARRTTVTFGQRTMDGRIAVADGVPQGAAVITSAAGPLSDSRAVRVSGGEVP